MKKALGVLVVCAIVLTSGWVWGGKRRAETKDMRRLADKLNKRAQSVENKAWEEIHAGGKRRLTEKEIEVLYRAFDFSNGARLLARLRSKHEADELEMAFEQVQDRAVALDRALHERRVTRKLEDAWHDAIIPLHQLEMVYGLKCRCCRKHGELSDEDGEGSHEDDGHAEHEQKGKHKGRRR